jgi:uncharacterized damage-inducible protein DinB
VAPAVADEQTRERSVRVIEDLPLKLREAVSGLSEAQIDTPYRPEGWTVRQLVHHVADSHMNSFIRFKLGMTEDNPTIKPYAEDLWAMGPDYLTAPIDLSLQILDSVHARWAILLRSMAASDFARTLFHPERGAMTLDTALSLYDWHSRHHTAHVTGLRERNDW